MTVRCALCGVVVGTAAPYAWGGPLGEDHLDYGELRPRENYGGEYDGQDYCDECYDGLVWAEADER
jgi:hypothetical protein